MRIAGKNYRTIWVEADPQPSLSGGVVCIIDQRNLPFDVRVRQLRSLQDMAQAIREMQVRGAPLIGVAGAYGVYLAATAHKNEIATPDSLLRFKESLKPLLEARPTAVNLRWGIEAQCKFAQSQIQHGLTWLELSRALAKNAAQLADADVACCEAIGRHGLEILRSIALRKPGQPLNILTHCNAGWLATIDYGTATAPIYLAQRAGIPLHVWVDETRPRLQGSKLTAFELGQEGVPHTIIVDNAGGHLMQAGQVDICIVGTDRTARNGDVANKIGTYLKALAAFDNKIPFYAAVPSSSIDWSLHSGQAIPIEDRGPHEVLCADGMLDSRQCSLAIAAPGSKAANPGFDVTPARLMSGLITERGICAASEEGLQKLFPEYKA